MLEKYIIAKKVLFLRIWIRELSSLAWEPKYHTVAEGVTYQEIWKKVSIFSKIWTQSIEILVVPLGFWLPHLALGYFYWMVLPAHLDSGYFYWMVLPANSAYQRTAPHNSRDLCSQHWTPLGNPHTRSSQASQWWWTLISCTRHLSASVMSMRCFTINRPIMAPTLNLFMLAWITVF